MPRKEARLLNHNFIGTEHILLGLIDEGEGVAAKALTSLDISLEAVRQKVAETIGRAGTVERRLAALYAAFQKGAGALATGIDAARPQLHRYRTHPPGAGARR